jgi:small-conductance mechanosensitive channel
MSMPALESLLTWPVGIYLVVVVGTQIAVAVYRRQRARKLAEERRAAGLGDETLVDHAIKLQTIRNQASVDAIVLLVTVVVLPIVLVQVFQARSEGLAVVFLGLVIWALVSATDVAKAFLGGVAFRAYVGLRQPFQVGDRVTLLGHAGKVEDIGPFFIRLNTVDDDQISIPTAALWSTPLVSANAGDRASLCVMTFHLAPFANTGQRKTAEDGIWDATQHSVYWDFDKPMQIYVEQRKDEIVLTAKAYVASTYNEALLKSDVYQAFLNLADRESIPLASTEWRRAVADQQPSHSPNSSAS